MLLLYICNNYVLIIHVIMYSLLAKHNYIHVIYKYHWESNLHNLQCKVPIHMHYFGITHFCTNLAAIYDKHSTKHRHTVGRQCCRVNLYNRLVQQNYKHFALNSVELLPISSIHSLNNIQSSCTHSDQFSELRIYPIKS